MVAGAEKIGHAYFDSHLICTMIVRWWWDDKGEVHVASLACPVD